MKSGWNQVPALNLALGDARKPEGEAPEQQFLKVWSPGQQRPHTPQTLLRDAPWGPHPDPLHQRLSLAGVQLSEFDSVAAKI